MPWGALAGMALQAGANALSQQQGQKAQERLIGMMSQKEMGMWQATNYPAQVDQMKKAGLNPGLQYGMSGGGGTTTGSGTAPTPFAYNPVQISEMALMDAQRAKLEAETRNLNTGSDYTAGAQTDKTRAETQLTQAEKDRVTLENDWSTRTMDDRVEAVATAADNLKYQSDILFDQKNVSRATYLTKIDQERANLAKTLVEKQALEQGIKLDQAKIDEITNRIAQAWKNLEIAQQNADANTDNARTNELNQKVTEARLNWDKEMKDVKESTKLGVEAFTGLVKNIIPGKFGGGGKGPRGATPQNMRGPRQGMGAQKKKDLTPKMKENQYKRRRQQAIDDYNAPWQPWNQ